MLNLVSIQSQGFIPLAILCALSQCYNTSKNQLELNHLSPLLSTEPSKLWPLSHFVINLHCKDTKFFIVCQYLM